MRTDLTPTEKRIQTARTWAKRVDALVKKRKKKKPEYSEAEFCRTHNFDYGFFNRNKNLRVIPSPKTVKAIEQALEAEGV